MQKWLAFLPRGFKGNSGLVSSRRPLTTMADSEPAARKNFRVLIGRLDKSPVPIMSLPRRTLVIREDKLDAKNQRRLL